MGFLCKYPELKMLTAGITVQTSTFDLQSLSVTKLATPQDINFFEYIFHFVDCSELIQIFYKNSTSFPMLDPKTKREVTSDEYFRARIIERALYGLQLLPITEEKQFEDFYTSTIKYAIEGRCYWSHFEEALLENTILRVEKLMSMRMEQVSLIHHKMQWVVQLYVKLLSLNVSDALIQLNPVEAESIFRRKKVSEGHLDYLTFCKAIQQYTRDYGRLDAYSKQANQPNWVLLSECNELREKNGFHLPAVDVNLLQEAANKLDIHAIREEKIDDRKAIVVRAVLQEKPLDIEYQLDFIASPYNHCGEETDTPKVPIRFSRTVKIQKKARLE